MPISRRHHGPRLRGSDDILGNVIDQVSRRPYRGSIIEKNVDRSSRRPYRGSIMDDITGLASASQASHGSRGGYHRPRMQVTSRLACGGARPSRTCHADRTTCPEASIFPFHQLIVGIRNPKSIFPFHQLIVGTRNPKSIYPFHQLIVGTRNPKSGGESDIPCGPCQWSIIDKFGRNRRAVTAGPRDMPRR